MIERDFAIGSYEFELQPDLERDYILNKFKGIAEFIDTAIDYNNDYIFSNVPDYKIISKISFCHFSNYEFFVSNHLKCLKRDFIDIMLIHSNRGDWIELAKKINEDSRFKEVGVSNFTKTDIIKYKEVIGKYPAYNEIEVNPYYLDRDTIDFCKENNIKIISYAILGGKYNSWLNVSNFSLPYLVSFAAHYSDIIICRSGSIGQADDFIDTITNYVPNGEYNPVITDDKSIEPMNYSLPKVTKYFKGNPTYNIACGKNTGKLKKEVLDIELPEFEMLGDYKVYIRYLFRQQYFQDLYVYDYDFLIGDDGNYYVVYLKEEDGKLTKVNHNAKIEVIKYEL